MRFRKGDGDGRVLFVSLILAVIVIVAYFTGAFGAIKQIIFGANQLPDFATTNSKSGMGLVAINLNDQINLQYFDGEKWKDIDTNRDYQFTLDNYVFNPINVRNSLYTFYAYTDRRPTNFQISVNDWRYWKISPLPFDDKIKTILMPVETLTKSGFPGSDLIASAFLDTNNNFVAKAGEHANKIFPQEKNTPAYPAVIAWRDSILEGNSCEKFVTLGLFKKTDKVNAPIVIAPTNYTVRKIEQYLFVDLSRPVSDDVDEEWKDEDCFEIEQYDDKLIDRSGWKNEADVHIDFRDNDARILKDTDSKILWTPFGQTQSFAWSYQSSKTKDKPVLLIDPRKSEVASNPEYEVPLKYYLKNYNDLYKGLLELSAVRMKNEMGAFNNAQEAYNIHVFVKFQNIGREVNLDKILVNTQRGLDNNPSVIGDFVYAILNEYNKHFLPQFYFESSSDGVLRLNKRQGISSVDTFVYLKDGFLYYYVVTKSKSGGIPILGESRIVGSVENGNFLISEMPVFEELVVDYPDIDELGYVLTVEALNYLNGKAVDSMFTRNTL